MSIVYEQDPEGGPGVVHPTAFGETVIQDAKDALSVARRESTDPAVIGPLAAAVFTEVRARRWSDEHTGDAMQSA